MYVGEEADPTLRRLRVDDAQQDMEIAESARPVVEPARLGDTAPDDEVSAPRYADQQEEDEQKENEDFDVLARTFDGLVGLGSVKLEMSTIVNVIRLGRRRIAIGLPPPPFVRHLLFAGGPGTGTTTVARLYARILHALDVTEHGLLVVAGRMSPTDGPAGQATAKVAAAFDRARGGVLYIGEAHTLAPPGGESRGESVSALIECMSQEQDETIVILAGEPDGLRRLVEANPELAEDFTRTVVFDDYTPEELTVILERQTLELRYGLGPGTREAVIRYLDHGQHDASPGSTLAARRLLQMMIERHAQRVAGLADPGARDLIELKPEDVPTVPGAATPPPDRLPPSDRLARTAPPARTEGPAKPTRAAAPSRPVNHNFD